MSQCWQEGEWRAYLDGELPADETAWGREHLVQCSACAAVHQELAARAVRVGAWIAELEGVPAVVRRRESARPRWQWAAAALAVAAALAAAFVLAPKRVEVTEPPRIAASPAAPPASATPLSPVAAHRVSRARAPRRRTQPVQYYLALDDEPIDTGTVMRVALASGAEADVIVDSAGRPRAIRAVR
jgi:putative zinc finger protein